MNTRFLLSALVAATLALPLAAQQGNMDSPFQVQHHASSPLPPVVTLPPGAISDPFGHFSFDIRGFYGFRAVPRSTYATDIIGLEVEFACYFTPRQAITLSASFGKGGNDAVNFMETPEGPVPVSEDYRRSDITLMLGYRFTQELTERVTLSLGLRGGLDVQRLSYEDSQARIRDKGHWEWDNDGEQYELVYDDHCYGKTRCGFAYAASVTLERRLTERLMLQLGYQYRGATTTPQAPSSIPGGSSVSAHAARWHEVHFGLRLQF